MWKRTQKALSIFFRVFVWLSSIACVLVIWYLLCIRLFYKERVVLFFRQTDTDLKAVVVESKRIVVVRNRLLTGVKWSGELQANRRNEWLKNDLIRIHGFYARDLAILFSMESWLWNSNKKSEDNLTALAEVKHCGISLNRFTSGREVITVVETPFYHVYGVLVIVVLVGIRLTYTSIRRQLRIHYGHHSG